MPRGQTTHSSLKVRSWLRNMRSQIHLRRSKYLSSKELSSMFSLLLPTGISTPNLQVEIKAKQLDLIPDRHS